jgi:cobalamin-dependent methionine synthase I
MIETIDDQYLIQQLEMAIVAGSGDVGSAVRACAAASLPLEALRAALLRAERVMGERGAGLRPDQSVRGIADRLSAALDQISGRWPALHGSAPNVSLGNVAMAGFPGDGHSVGRKLWRLFLGLAGYTVHDLGMHAPVIIARESGMRQLDALALNLFDRRSRAALHVLVVNLLRRGMKLPLLLGGSGVDAAFARWLAVAESSGPYWGGVYYCEDGAEMLQVLQQVVLFEPPPAADDHDHASHASPVDACGSCSGCALAAACDSVMEDGDEPG